MTDQLSQPSPENAALEVVKGDLIKDGSTRSERIFGKFFIAAIGAIPWVGGFLAAAASIPGDEASVRTDNLQTQWLDEHRKKLALLRQTLADVTERLQQLGPNIEDRMESPEYLTLVRQTFRAWDGAATDDKRRYVANLVTNAAGTRLCSDDVVRLFITWLDNFHEAHFAVIGEVYENPGSTRFGIWSALYGDLPREDSAEADLFKLLIRDLSTGGVLRQLRDTNEAGQYIRRRPARRRGPAPATLESAFEDSKPYVLTELGKQFVHYTMTELVRRLEQAAPQSP